MRKIAILGAIISTLAMPAAANAATPRQQIAALKARLAQDEAALTSIAQFVNTFERCTYELPLSNDPYSGDIMTTPSGAQPGAWFLIDACNGNVAQLARSAHILRWQP